MKKSLHRFLVKGTDDAQIDMLRTRWITMGIYASRREAWALVRSAASKHWQHIKVVEERIFSAN
jgi:hypothetical protein